LVEKWVEAFDRDDADKIAEFYSEEAINHQAAESPIQSKAAIKDMFAREFAQAEMTCIVENLFLHGEWALLFRMGHILREIRLTAEPLFFYIWRGYFRFLPLNNYDDDNQNQNHNLNDDPEQKSFLNDLNDQ
jgi:hypothetical protein